MNVEERLSHEIARLVLEICKRDAAIEMQNGELARRADIIKKLTDAEPKLPFDSANPTAAGINGTH